MQRPSELAHITPKYDQRMIIVGATGTGKSTLAQAILPAFEYQVVIDPIHVLGGKKGLSDYKMAETPEQLALFGRRHKKLQYRPTPQHQNWQSYNIVYHWIFERGETMCYTDEGLRVMRHINATEYMNACLTAGRQRGVGMITCTQRPTGIDLRLLSEAEHYVCFRLRQKADRQRMAEVMGEDVARRPAEGHSFWYSNDRMERPIYLSLGGV